MAKLTIFSTGRLTANRDDRTISGLLLPFNEVGRTNLGRLTASADTRLTASADVVLNVEHDPKRPIGKAVRIERGPDGIRGVFSIAKTRAGDDALAEAEAGLRGMFSVELEPIVTRAGRIVSGQIDGAGLVAQGAFPSARLAAADMPDVPDMGDQPPAEEDQTEATDPPADGQVVEQYTTDSTDTYLNPDGTQTVIQSTSATTITEQEPTVPTMTAARVQTPNLAGPKGKTPVDKNRLFAALAAFNKTPGARLEAALSDITTADILGTEQPQYVGQLWDGTAYDRIIVPGFNHADLTSMKIQGWRFVEGKKPQVSKYLGDKTAVPSNDVQTEPHDEDAYRIAGGWDIDRKFRDFSNEAFWAAFFAAVTEDYKLKSDTYALEDILAAATVVAPGAVPAGVDPGMAAIVDGIIAILNTTRTLADGAYVSTDLWRNTMLTRGDDMLPMLNAMLGFEEGTMRNFQLTPCADLDAGQVLVKVRAAVTVHELPGEAPIRVEALDIARGGIDEGVFGYQAVDIHNAKGLALVTVGAL